MAADERTELPTGSAPPMTTQDMTEGARPWMGEALATDGLTPPRQAVKVTVLYPDEPNATVQQQLRAQAVGQFRVHYGGWPKTTPTVTVRPL